MLAQMPYSLPNPYLLHPKRVNSSANIIFHLKNIFLFFYECAVGWRIFIIPCLFDINSHTRLCAFAVFPASCVGNILDHMATTLEICLWQNILNRKNIHI